MKLATLILLLASPLWAINIVESEVTKDKLYIKVSDGRTWTITRAEIRANYMTQTGTAAQRKQKTIDWVKDQALAALGEMIGTRSNMVIDFNAGDDNEVMSMEIN